MKALSQISSEKVQNNLEIIENEIKSIKNVFPEMEKFKNRFYVVREREVLDLKTKITREKALSRIIYSENRETLTKINKQYKLDVYQAKTDHNYVIYELKENRKLSLQKMKASSKNYLNELDSKSELLKTHLSMLEKNRDPKTLVDIEEIDLKIDRLILGNESVKQNYKVSKVRENALLQNDGVKFFKRRELMKDIKEKLQEKRTIEMNKNNQAILELREEKKVLIEKTFDNKGSNEKAIISELEKIQKQRDDFVIKFEDFYLKEEEKINNEYETNVNAAQERIELILQKIKDDYTQEKTLFLNENSRAKLKEQKLNHKLSIKTFKKELKQVRAEVKLQEQENKEETKAFILRQKAIRQDAKANIKIMLSEIREEQKSDKLTAQENEDLNTTVSHVNNDIRSMNKVVMQQRITRLFKNVNTAYFFIAPAIFGAVVFTLLPMAFMLIVAFFKLDIVNIGKSQFVGFNNFYEIFAYDVQFRQSLVNTLIYALITIGLLSIVTLSMAAWLSKNTRVHNAVTTMVFTPHIASLVAISILWIALLSPTGLVNQVLAFFGIEGPRWLLQENTSLLSVSMVTVWKDIGYYVLLIIAGLQAIPAYVYEAAKLDKSSKARTFFKVTVPLLAPTLSFVFVNKFINSFKVFAPIEIMTNGGPMGSSTVLSYWIYKVGRLGFNYGQAMAGAIILTLIITFFTIINFKFFNRKIEY